MISVIGTAEKRYSLYPGTFSHNLKTFSTSYGGHSFVEWNGEKKDKTLDLRSDVPKAIITIYNSIYPFLSVVDAILSFMKDPDIKDVEIIIDTSPLGNKSTNFSNWLPEILISKNIKYKLIDSSEYEHVLINNFYIIFQGFTLKDKMFLNFYEESLDFVKNKSQKPFRKVFVSREEHDRLRNIELYTRCDDQKKLEDSFRSRGFEICYPEKDFNTFSEQVSYFYECKVIAGLSGGGLANALFMRPEGKMVELLTSFKFDYQNNGKVLEEMHGFYQHISFLQKHCLITISNIDRRASEIERLMEVSGIFNDRTLK